MVKTWKVILAEEKTYLAETDDTPVFTAEWVKFSVDGKVTAAFQAKAVLGLMRQRQNEE